MEHVVLAEQGGRHQGEVDGEAEQLARVDGGGAHVLQNGIGGILGLLDPILLLRPPPVKPSPKSNHSPVRHLLFLHLYLNLLLNLLELYLFIFRYRRPPNEQIQKLAEVID